MLNLNKDEKLQVLLAGAVSTTEGPMTVTYEDGPDETRRSRKTAHGISTGVTAVDLVPGVGGGRKITGFSFYNADSASVTVTVRAYFQDGTTRIIRKQALLTLESLHWDQSRGWYTIDANGSTKTASTTADSANQSTAQSVAVSGGLQGSTVLSAATSAGLADSVSRSAATSAGLRASVLQSEITSGTI